jgi:hypothetical protein
VANAWQIRRCAVHSRNAVKLWLLTLLLVSKLTNRRQPYWWLTHHELGSVVDAGLMQDCAFQVHYYCCYQLPMGLSDLSGCSPPPPPPPILIAIFIQVRECHGTVVPSGRTFSTCVFGPGIRWHPATGRAEQAQGLTGRRASAKFGLYVAE